MRTVFPHDHALIDLLAGKRCPNVRLVANDYSGETTLPARKVVIGQTDIDLDTLAGSTATLS